MKFIALLVLIGSLVFAESDSLNGIQNPRFTEGSKHWNMWGATFEKRGDHQILTLKASNEKWLGIDQIIQIPEGAKKIEFKLWLEGSDLVRRSDPKLGMRVLIQGLGFLGEVNPKNTFGFFQKAGSYLGKHYSFKREIPATVNQFKLQIAFPEAKGSAKIDSLGLYFFDSDGEALAPQNRKLGIHDFGEWYEIPKDTNISGLHYIDWSSLLPKPAGKFGFVKVKGENFIFENGKIARFLGVNLVGNQNFPDSLKAKELSSSLAKLGVNVVRLHHMDAHWTYPNLFGKEAQSTDLDSLAMDKLDFFIHQLKEKGIYVFMDLVVHRKFFIKDGAPEKTELGAKQISYFDPTLRKLQKDFAQKFFTHFNPYTGLAYKNDPVFMGVNLLNESSFLTGFNGSNVRKGHYKNLLDSLWRAEGHQGDFPQFSNKYGTEAVLLDSKAKEAEQAIEFANRWEEDFFKDMKLFLDSLGVQIPVSGSNFPLHHLHHLKSRTTLDFIANNTYWDHPEMGSVGGDWSRVHQAKIKNTSQIAHPEMNLVFQSSFFQVKNKPMVLTEWQHGFPNEYLGEAMPLLVWYGLFQGVDGLIEFDYAGSQKYPSRVSPFSINHHLEMIGNWAWAAPIFLRGQIEEGDFSYVEPVNKTLWSQLPSYANTLRKNSHLPYTLKYRKEFIEEKPNQKELDSLGLLLGKKNWKSSTQQLEYDRFQGQIKVETEALWGLSGNWANEWIDRGDFLLMINNPSTTLIAFSESGEALEKAEIIYLFINTPLRFKNEKWNSNRTQLMDYESGARERQVIQGRLLVKKNRRLKSVSELNEYGEVKKLSHEESFFGNEINLKELRCPLLKIEFEKR